MKNMTWSLYIEGLEHFLVQFFFTLLFHLHQEASLLAIEVIIICISEVADISTGSLDSSL